MRKRFVAKHSKDFSLFFKIFLFCLLIIFIISKIMSLKFFNSNEQLIKYIMEESNHLIETDLTYSSQIYGANLLITNMNIKEPFSLFQNNLIYQPANTTDINSSEKIIDAIKNIMNLISFDTITNNPSKMVNKSDNQPLVYIYNTHQTESYANSDIDGLTPNVFTAAHILKDNLEKRGISTIVEENNISQYLNNNNLTYDDSYIASRYYLEQIINQYPSIKIFIDLHRDALSYDFATIQYEGKNYAKILLLVGLDHEKYQQNLDFNKELNASILEKYPFLTRGILTKTGPLVNGIYNQDLNEHIIVLEVGGNENNIIEVSNTLELISDIISVKVGELNV